jgi:hypothetical protein
MVTVDTIEGIIDQFLWFHYDLTADVLYLRLKSARESEAVGEEMPDGTILLTDAETDRPIGLTVVNWWKRFGRGAVPDSLSEIQASIAPWAGKLAA